MFKQDFQSKSDRVKRFALVGPLIISAVLVSGAQAGGKDDHAHEEAGKTQMMMNGLEMKMENEHEDGGHAHDAWVAPPARYAQARNYDWDDKAAVNRGHEIFEARCATCHGIDGQGTGPAADALSHKPADLTNHFHRGPGMGDAYLYWRVSEGGLVEPFRSRGSAMPAFKEVLSERERWDVLTYVHNIFHQTFSGMHDEDNGEGPVGRH